MGRQGRVNPVKALGEGPWLENRSVRRGGRRQGPRRGHGDGSGSPEGKRGKGEGQILAGAPPSRPRDKGVALLALPLIC